MIGVITSDGAFAWCMSQPGARSADCRLEVADQMVGGVYCDGTVVMKAGAPKRCVPTGVLASKLAAAAKDPLPVAAVAPDEGIPPIAYGIAALAVLGLGYLILR